MIGKEKARTGPSPVDAAEGGSRSRLSTIIFVNRFFHPDVSATSQMLSDLAFGLAAAGHLPIVVTSRCSYESGGSALLAEETISGVRIVRVATTNFGRYSTVGRMSDYITFYISATVVLCWMARRGDVLVAKTDPPLLSVPVGAVAWLKGARLVAWLQDIFPETAVALGLARCPVSRTALAALRHLRNASLRSASRTVVIGEEMARFVRGLGVADGSVTVIANWADGRALRPVERDVNRLRADWELGEAFVVGYSGNLGRAHDIETVIDAIAEVEARGRNEPGQQAIIWLFVGGGVQTGSLKERARRRGLTTLRFEPYQPRERLSESLSVADLHLISLRPELEGLIVPSKLYGIAAVGRPAIFVGNVGGEIGSILATSAFGRVVAPGDGRALADAVLKAARDPVETSRRGKLARQWFEASSDLAPALASWEQLLAEVSASGLHRSGTDHAGSSKSS